MLYTHHFTEHSKRPSEITTVIHSVAWVGKLRLREKHAQSYIDSKQAVRYQWLYHYSTLPLYIFLHVLISHLFTQLGVSAAVGQVLCCDCGQILGRMRNDPCS